MLRYWRRVGVGALVVLALLGANALAQSPPSGRSAPARLVPAARPVFATPPFSPASSVAAAHRSAAIANADQILGAIAMPPGSSRVAEASPGAKKLLSQKPFLQLFYQAQVDRREYWVSAASESSILSSISSHLPAGSKSNGSATSSYDAEAAYRLPTVARRVLGIRQLVVHLVPLNTGQTAARFDAEVQYLAPWKPGQRIPAAARFLQITKGPWNSRSPRVVGTVTGLDTVRRIAKLIEALPFEGNTQGDAFSCPALPGPYPIDKLTFRSTRDGPVLAQLTESAGAGNYPNPCESPTLTIRGHDDPPIAGGKSLLTAVDRLLGVRLTAR